MLRTSTIFRYLGILSLISVISLFIAISVGSYAISWDTWHLLFTQQAPSMVNDIIWHIRLPRALTAFSCGALLALSGCLLQVLLRNPLADPYLLGASGGAALGVFACVFYSLPIHWHPLAAFAGALTSTWLVFKLTRWQSRTRIDSLLLIGLTIAITCHALLCLLLSLVPDHTLHSMMWWLIGDVVASSTPWLLMLTVLLALCVSLLMARPLNVLCLGEQHATSFGLSTTRLQQGLFLLSALFVAISVSQVGSIGFIGLLAPHLLRLVGLRHHAFLLPGSALLGGSLLVIADTLARTLWSPQQLPVGALIALIGAPLWLLMIKYRSF